MSDRCRAKLQPPHPGSWPVQCRYLAAEEHEVHYGVDHEAPRTIRRWRDSGQGSGAAIVDRHGTRINRTGDAS